MGMRYLSCKADSAILTCNSHTQTITTTTNTSTNDNHNNNNNNIIKKKKKNKNKNKNNNITTIDEENTNPTIQHFNYSDLEAATDGFSAHKLLGRGSHGCVYKGVLHNGRLVAIKKPSRPSNSPHISSFEINSNTSTITEVENEIEILSNIRSPRLVNLVGFSTTPIKDSSSSSCSFSSASSSRLLVVEFMSNGTLFDVLHSGRRPLGWGRRIRLALQTALAIDTLHSSIPPVIHRDIKSANILIDRNFNARLGDFGLALRCFADDYRLRSTPPAGTLGYLDPCYVTPDNLSTKTDVFSFGILLLEIISGRKAIDVGHSPPSIVDWAIPIVRKGKVIALFDPRIPPPKDASARKQLVLLAARCVRSCRERRPSMKEIVEGLKVLSKTVPGNLWDNLTVNPCMMVDEVGHAIGTRIPNSSSGMRQQRAAEAEEPPVSAKKAPNSAKGVRVIRNTSRVFSDSGSSSRNLKDLMAGMDKESDFCAFGLESSTSGIMGVRIGSGRSNRRTKSQPIGHDYDSDGIFRLRVNQS